MTPLITLFFLNVSDPGLVLLPLLSPGSNLTYLIARSFYVSIDGAVSPVYQLLYGVPQGSVLGPLLFILYAAPLSTIIYNSSTNHHLYTDDTQLFLSFSAALILIILLSWKVQFQVFPTGWPPIFSHLILCEKTGFLIIGLPQQQSKLSSPTIRLPNNVTLSPVDSARNLSVILEKKSFLCLKYFCCL